MGYFACFYPCGWEDSIRKGIDESPQPLNILAFYTLMKQAFGLYAQEQGCPVPVARINGSEPAQNSSNGQ